MNASNRINETICRYRWTIRALVHAFAPHLELRLPTRGAGMRWHLLLVATSLLTGPLHAADVAAGTADPVQHPALFLVGDSIMQTGTGNGDSGPWGWGSEIGAFFDPQKLHVYNEGRGGRSSRGYIEEGAWAKVLERLQPGDFVIVQFGHNDTANSANYPDRATINAGGDEVLQVGVGDARRIIRTYGAYLRQYVADAKAKGATAILCSPVPRNQWEGGKMKRGFDGYAQWAADAARRSGAWFIDLNAIAADRYDALGQEQTRAYFNDTQHTNKAGARLNAEAVVAGLRQLEGLALTGLLAPVVRFPH
jgi:rhamnogalacturonan acetylesterase